MSRSIISNERKCFVCGTTIDLEKHHIYYSAYRSKAERFGCWCYLCRYHHREQGGTGSHNPVHLLDVWLQQECQKRFEEIYDHETFMKEFGINYLGKDLGKEYKK